MKMFRSRSSRRSFEIILSKNMVVIRRSSQVSFDYAISYSAVNSFSQDWNGHVSYLIDESSHRFLSIAVFSPSAERASAAEFHRVSSKWCHPPARSSSVYREWLTSLRLDSSLFREEARSLVAVHLKRLFTLIIVRPFSNCQSLSVCRSLVSSIDRPTRRFQRGQFFARDLWNVIPSFRLDRRSCNRFVQLAAEGGTSNENGTLP